MIALTAYTDRLSGAPGDRIAFKATSAGTGPVHASLVRIRRGDPNPAGLRAYLASGQPVIHIRQAGEDLFISPVALAADALAVIAAALSY